MGKCEKLTEGKQHSSSYSYHMGVKKKTIIFNNENASLSDK